MWRLWKILRTAVHVTFSVVLAKMVDCSLFLEEYSAFRDGELEERVRTHFEAHLAACSSCARYDRVVSEGVRLYREFPHIQPSDDFLPRLQHRIFHLEEEMKGPGRIGSGASATMTMAIAAMIALAAWIPAARTQAPVHELPPVAARAPVPAAKEPALLFRSGPLLAPSDPLLRDWNSVPASRVGSDLFFQYSPLNASYGVPVSQR